MRVLVVNAGSSSLKLRLLGDDDVLHESADLEPGDAEDLAQALTSWPKPDVVGHRIVHGGNTFTGPIRIDDRIRAQLQDLTDLAPLHQPASLAGLDAVTEQLPNVASVACFDTAFHATIPIAAATYPVPARWREEFGVRRFGFHGLSHAYASRRAAEMSQTPAKTRVITCHLGGGASLAAVLDGVSVDTTMGFTPLEGLMMATRSGSVDPGLVLWLQQQRQLSADDVSTALESQSGLLALAGTADMREVEAGVQQGNDSCQLALDVYVHRLAAGIAAMSASLAGLDILVFTGGVGEHSPMIRRRVAEKLTYLGVQISEDDCANADRDISETGAPVTTLVITAREDLEVARQLRQLLGR
jgi:acetate kinase